MKKMLQVRLELSEWQEVMIRAVKANQSLTDYVRERLGVGYEKIEYPRQNIEIGTIPKEELAYPAQDVVRSLESKVQEIPAVIPVKKSVLTRGVVTSVAATSSMTTESAPAPAPPGMTISEAPSGYGGVSSDVQHST